MPSNRKIIFANNEYYHIFNRGVEKRPTFTTKYEYVRARDSLNFYRFGELPIRYSKFLNLGRDKKAQFLHALNTDQLQIEIIAYCLMRNHFHFLLKQIKEHGIVKFMAKYTNSYTKYFNTKDDRVGPLFQGVFKAVHVENDEQLLHLSRYIHLNPVLCFIFKAEELSQYQWSSYPEYLDEKNSSLVNAAEVLTFFKSRSDYKDFVLDQVDYAKQARQIEHLIID